MTSTNRNNIEELKKSLESAFIDKNVESQLAFQPRLLTNDHSKGKKVLPYIEKELSTCQEFFISVAEPTKMKLQYR